MDGAKAMSGASCKEIFDCDERTKDGEWNLACFQCELQLEGYDQSGCYQRLLYQELSKSLPLAQHCMNGLHLLGQAICS